MFFIISSPIKLIKWIKIAKVFYENPSDYSKISLFSETNKCTNLFLQAKTDNIAKLIAKLDDLNFSPKT